MRRKLICLAAAILFMAAPPAAMADEWPIGEMNHTIDQTNFVVNEGCSGTLIDLQARYVLTANHCVADQYENVDRERIDDKGVVHKEKVRVLKQGSVRQIYFQDAVQTREVRYTTELKGYDADHDLALLHIVSSIPNTESTPIACANPVRGERVYIVGNPKGFLYSSVVAGIVSSVDRTYRNVYPNDQPDAPLMQISGGVIGGNSGGAAYNDRGQLIGVPVLAYPNQETVAFAVPLRAIRAFLKEQNVKTACTAE